LYNVNKSELSVAFNSNFEPVTDNALLFSLKVTPPYVNPSVKLKVSILAVPSINKSFHCFALEPISCLSSFAGISDDDTLFITISPLKLAPWSNVLPVY
jgi:hypothetical protein